MIHTLIPKTVSSFITLIKSFSLTFSFKFLRNILNLSTYFGGPLYLSCYHLLSSFLDIIILFYFLLSSNGSFFLSLFKTMTLWMFFLIILDECILSISSSSSDTSSKNELRILICTFFFNGRLALIRLLVWLNILNCLRENHPNFNIILLLILLICIKSILLKDILLPSVTKKMKMLLTFILIII